MISSSFYAGVWCADAMARGLGLGICQQKKALTRKKFCQTALAALNMFSRQSFITKLLFSKRRVPLAPIGWNLVWTKLARIRERSHVEQSGSLPASLTAHARAAVAVDGAVPVDATTAPTRTWKTAGLESGFPHRPPPSS